ncbi:T9SS type A sorting domain-containing protein [Candidatus Kaistella beijingensis]|uniref:T9SS type A sorting domain-containing protein n=1 Tax=Candidatus Kaistella beijingensis TaxID=2820270 RepID=UPI001CC52061|nr:T9SS type A sorting domain-containing protein [Candidatus Kaistella beijingensis]UBB88651.1 T9SS type A sorting domain-containing protein [Candidatus Kaistella beijingensis]
MKKLIVIASLAFGTINLNAQVYFQANPEGYGAATTGGGNTTPVTVSDYATLKTQLTTVGSKVILVSGTITIPQNGQISAVISNKSLIGLPGAKLVNENQTGAGILNLRSGSNNVIIRNLIFVGPGAYDINGPDNLTNQGGTNIWVDHCEFQDGQDGNFDNSGLSDNITISWNKFTYLKAPIPGGSGGSNDHRFSNLVGSSATDAPADGNYSITFQSNYWAEGCKERMPRARNAQLHILNSYYNTSVPSSLAIGLGGGSKNSNVYVENTNFANVTSIFRNYVSTDGGTIAINYVNSLFKGNPVSTTYDVGTVSKPNYSYTVMPVEQVAQYVPDPGCGAGATLLVAADGTITPGVCSFMAVENTEKSYVKIYPVPVKEVLNIEIPQSRGRSLQVDIFSATGRKAISTSLNNNGKAATINVQHLPKGVYFGTLKTAENSYPVRFIKN